MGQQLFDTAPQLCCYAWKAAVDNMDLNGCVCVLTTLYLETLKLEFYVIFSCHRYSLSSNHFKHAIIPKLKWSEVKSLSRVWLFVTPWTVAYQASPSVGFSRQGYWSGLPFPNLRAIQKKKKQIGLEELLHTYSERLMQEVSSSVTYNCNKISVPLKHKQ